MKKFICIFMATFLAIILSATVFATHTSNSTVKGKVFQDWDNDGVWDSNEPWMWSKMVLKRTSSDYKIVYETFTTWTDMSGFFSFTNKKHGYYTLAQYMGICEYHIGHNNHLGSPVKKFYLGSGVTKIFTIGSKVGCP